MSLAHDLLPQSFTLQHTLMGEQPNILKAKALCLNNYLILVHSGSSKRATLIQASNLDSTTKLDKRAGVLSSTTSTPILANSVTN
jgi:hypothetical protein